MSAGDTLGGLLARAGIDAALRSEFALAIMTEFDLSGLRPGHRVAVQKRADGTALSITLTITDGERVMVTLDDQPEVQRLAPKTTRVERAQSLTVEGVDLRSIGARGRSDAFCSRSGSDDGRYRRFST